MTERTHFPQSAIRQTCLDSGLRRSDGSIVQFDRLNPTSSRRRPGSRHVAKVRKGSHTAEAVVAAARAWIGTPYHHQASLRGVGADCLGLIRGVWRDLYGNEAEAPPAYSRDWGEVSGEETLIGAAARHLVPRGAAAPEPGDVLLFRMRPGAIAKHAALLATPQTMIHAMEDCRVAEIPYGAWWRRRLAAVFAFPGTQR